MKNIIAMLFGFVGAQQFTAFGPSKAKTVDGVLATFNKTIADLKDVEQAELAEVAKQAEIARAADEARKAATVEAQRAAKAVEQFSKLVDGI